MHLLLNLYYRSVNVYAHRHPNQEGSRLGQIEAVLSEQGQEITQILWTVHETDCKNTEDVP